MTFRDIAHLLEPWIDYPNIPSVKYPKGHTYRVPSPDHATGLKLVALAALAGRQVAGEDLSVEELRKINLNDDEESDFVRKVLGSAQDEMLADGVADMTVRLIARDVFYVLTSSEDLAQLVLQGEAVAREAARIAATATGPKAASGSSSSRASGATRARTRKKASTRSSSAKTEAPTA